ncbi:MAG: helix-turn-helix domain-containing protein [Nocardioidaceae bacterium]|nr:helix-turn-helix domain-containing protein [Nocardioidaceae bacterium]
MPIGSGQPRFLPLADVAEVLNTSVAQVYALVRRGELPAIKLGGRGQWRVESEQLEAFIVRQYSDTRVYIKHHPWGGSDVGEFIDAADNGGRREDS